MAPESPPAGLVDNRVLRHAGNPYDLILAISEDATRSSAAYDGLVAVEPYAVAADTWSRRVTRYPFIKSWQGTSLELLASSIRGDADPCIAAALLDELPDHVGWSHHRRIALDRTWTPRFFRTDESADGTILEVQCPGSLWGVHEILREFYIEAAIDPVPNLAPLSVTFADSLRSQVAGRPIIHHLLDNSSHPAGERFFIQRARRYLPYFGYDSEVRPCDCNVIRAHDFIALLAENFTVERLERWKRGELIYDLPPISLFDQKLLLALPFWNQTRAFYRDEVRGLFPYTAILTPEGITLEDGGLITIQKFSGLPRRDRTYFLKYAGADVSRNWGSRAVYHLGKLSRERCEAELTKALRRFPAGERWILQRQQPTDESVETITRDGTIETIACHSKHSVFHGRHGPMAVLVMFENFYKVHGSSETVATIGVPPAGVPQTGLG